MKNKLKTRDEILKILRTGKFTIYFHDNDPGAWSIYDTFVDSNEIEDWDEFDAVHKLYEGTGYGEIGYAPEEAVLLVEALGGQIEST